MNKIDTHTGIIAWFARNNVAANLLMVILIVGGLYGANAIQKKLYPNLELNIVSVRVPYLKTGRW